MRNFKVKTKILLLTLLSGIILLAVGCTGYFAMKQMAAASENMYQNNLRSLNAIGQVSSNNSAIEAYVMEMMLTEDYTANQNLSMSISDRTARNAMAYSELEKIALSADAKALYDEYSKLTPNYFNVRSRIVDLATRNQDREAYGMFSSELQPIREQVNQVVNKLNTQLLREAQNNNEASLDLASASTLLIFICIGVGVLLIAGGGLLIARLVSDPLRQMQQMMRKAEGGDLSVQGTYLFRDEIGQVTQSFNRMIAGLRDMIRQVDDSASALSASSQQLAASAEQTTGAAGHIATSSAELSAGFETQAKAIVGVSGFVDEMEGNMRRLGKTGEEIAGSVQGANEAAERGSEEVQKTIGRMNEIDRSVAHALEVVKGLRGRSEEIGAAAVLIDQVAKQTNLLSLNASIEAARAGEAGRGFAVVAQEIRKLAESAADSTRTISRIIAAIQEESEAAVTSLNEGADRAKRGVESGREISEVFGRIRSSVTGVRQETGEAGELINLLMSQTSRIADAMREVSSIAQQGAAGIEEVSAAGEEQLSTMEEVQGSALFLSELAEGLQSALSRFTLDGTGTEGAVILASEVTENADIPKGIQAGGEDTNDAEETDKLNPVA
ncbi:methyl-accepting chemotaxis protein [Saccharibacillus alkalitolerans]|uniref:Methyl-accepting chemotaxis protein n=1 Tax=Saccharibacillus alkalitolerans TaxID=2705290 RepID=A0ABX0F555_9BACL|nr:methyl-accepting chemotaxis protein [Saccharibacillus alkalitolerans]NGZ76073.1 methyl-accepting chemotaxis protein [Saccharibacillus alkalitolerans]